MLGWLLNLGFAGGTGGSPPPPPPQTDTVRTRIVAKIVTWLSDALSAAGLMGVVYPPGARTADEERAINEARASGKVAALLVIGDSENVDPEQQVLETLEMEVGVCLMLPGDTGGRAADAFAEDLHALVYKLYAGGGVGDETWANLALHTRLIGGGALVLDPDFGEVTASVFRVTYRHRRGDPTIAA